MAGLLCANMMRRNKPTVYEAKSELPDMHKAVLRFRNTSVSEVTGIPFKNIFVRKGLVTEEGHKDKASLYDANNYSLKATSGIEDRSVHNLEACERYLAPENFCELMGNNVEVEFNSQVNESTLEAWRDRGDLTISTIPMPSMMAMLNYDSGINFRNYTRSIWVIKTKLQKPYCKVNQTLYNSDLSDYWYRATVHEDDLIIECDDQVRDMNELKHIVVQQVLNSFCGLSADSFDYDDPTVHNQPIGKILPIDEHARKEFIWHLTHKYNVYSLGRFATWRPLLLDHVVNDVRVIENLYGTSHYNHNHKTNES